MINFNELEKAVTAGKVVTLVVMVDGKEFVAVSFKTDTIAFKEILETVVKAPVTIADKPKETKKTDPVKSSKSKVEKEKNETRVIETQLDAIEDLDDEEEEIDEEDADNENEDEKPDLVPTSMNKKDNIKSVLSPEKPKKEPVDWDKPMPRTAPMTREQIMSATPDDINQGKVKVSEVINAQKEVIKEQEKIQGPANASLLEEW